MAHSELEAFFSEHAEYYRTSDAAGIMNHYADASLFWEACGSSLKGKDEIHGWFGIMFNRWQVESIDFEIVANRLNDGMACCACFWKIRCCEDQSDDGMENVTVRATYGLENRGDGWKIWHVHGSR